MATLQEGWNSLIGGLGDIAGVTEKFGGAFNAWKKTTPDVGGSNAATNNTSLDNLASSLTESARQNQKLLIFGGLGAIALIAGIFIFKKK